VAAARTRRFVQRENGAEKKQDEGKTKCEIFAHGPFSSIEAGTRQLRGKREDLRMRNSITTGRLVLCFSVFQGDLENKISHIK
jgi:hypothetical protein